MFINIIVAEGIFNIFTKQNLYKSRNKRLNMVFKINISRKDGRTFHLDLEMENLSGKKIGETLKGEELHSDLSGYILKINGLSDKSGFPSLNNVEGPNLRKKLLTYGQGMKEKSPAGMKKKKTVRGNVISLDTIQINTSIEKEGTKKLEEVFPDQKPKEKVKWVAPKPAEEAKPEEAK
jgi:small subunit ribosomal protein S6e